MQVLSRADIERGLMKGKVTLGRQYESAQTVDVEDAIATALLAYEDGLYYVFLDDEQQTESGRRSVSQTGNSA